MELSVAAANSADSSRSVSFVYDYNGNMTSKSDTNGAATYTWDFDNRLTSVTLPGSAGTITFKYDPFGRRIQKSSFSGTVNYLYDGANVVTEVDPAGNVMASYTQGPGIDEPLAMSRSGVTSYYQADGLGSVTSLTNGGGALVATYSYDAFGNVTTSAGNLINSFRYTGREWDSETGLYYYRARYYDPGIGRFVSEDPAGFGGGINFYAYVKNDPVDFIDPTGLKCWQSSPWTEIPNMWGPNGPTPYLTITDGVNWVRTGWSYAGLGIDKTHCICQWVASHTRVR